MSASPVGPSQTAINVAVLTPLFQIRGSMQVLGNLQTYLNDDQRPTFSVQTASVLGLAMSNPAAQMSQAEMFVLKQEAHVIAIEGVPPAGAIMLQPRFESLVLYTPLFAIMGKFHMGPDVRLADFTATSIVQFLPVSECRFFPLYQSRPGMVGGASVALVQRSAVVTYHRS